MNIRFLNPKFHGLLDYAAATGLIVLPVAFGFEGLALWLSVAGGLGLIAYSLLTDYAFGPFALIPFKVHLAMDLMAAVAFIAAPFIFGWSGLVMGYYLVMAVGVIAVVAVSNTDPVNEQQPSAVTAS